MRLVLFLALLGIMGVSACAAEISMNVDLQHANVRAPFQTDPGSVLVLPGDVERPYDVLSDLGVVVRQRTAFGLPPTKEGATRALQEQAGRIGAHAILMVSFGDMGMGLWSYKELRGQGRAVRFR